MNQINRTFAQYLSSDPQQALGSELSMWDQLRQQIRGERFGPLGDGTMGPDGRLSQTLIGRAMARRRAVGMTPPAQATGFRSPADYMRWLQESAQNSNQIALRGGATGGGLSMPGGPSDRPPGEPLPLPGGFRRRRPRPMQPIPLR